MEALDIHMVAMIVTLPLNLSPRVLQFQITVTKKMYRIRQLIRKLILTNFD